MYFWTRRVSPDGELLPKSDILESQLATSLEGRDERANKLQNHNESRCLGPGNNMDAFDASENNPSSIYWLLFVPNPECGIVDLGCGPGELTDELHRLLSAHEALGIDISEAMLREADGREGEGLSFRQQDIADFADSSEGAAYDLVFSNAALQWIPDHRELISRLTEALAEDGQLAIQVPANFDHVSHETASEIAGESPFREALGGFTHPLFVLQPEAYASLLDELRYREQHVRLQVLCLLFIHPPAPWVGSQPCGAKYPGFCADSKGV